MPSSLPIEQIRGDLGTALRQQGCVILHAPTGSGKSTQVPQMLLDEGLVAADKQVLVLQPRRLAARLLAKRIASERQGRLGDEVGFHIRFDRVFGPATRIKFVTEAILLRMMLRDPLLKEVGSIVFDEFHERHLYSDLGLAMAFALQKEKRPDLKLVVMSATLDIGGLQNYLEPCATLAVEGRTYPITMEYSARAAKVADAPVWDQAAYHFRQLYQDHPEGDFLIFMPGAYEIQRTIENIQSTPEGKDCVVLPLYGDLPPDKQDAAVASYDRRKVVVATNVAETSLTIDGIRVVIDSGLARIARYDAHRGINTLLIEKISRSSAEQRAGRAGRTAPGHCLRLWGEREHQYRPERETAEILRLDLSETVLSLKMAGIWDLDAFPWYERPDPRALQRAVTLLHDLGALDASEALTPMGRRMAEFPMHPRYARMFLAADELGCVSSVSMIAALAQGRNILLPLRDKRQEEEREAFLGDTESDFFHLLRAWGMARKQEYQQGICRKWGIHAQAARQAEQVGRQFLKIASSQGLDTTERPLDEIAVRQCLLLAFSDQLALRDNEGTLRCSLVHGRRGELRRHSAVRHAPLFVAAEIDEVESRGEVTVFLSLATAVERSWLQDYFPDDFQENSETFWDTQQRRVIRKRQVCFRDLVLEARDNGEPDPGQAATILARKVMEGELVLKQWDQSVENWITRVNYAARHCPELEIEALDDEGRLMVIEQICLGAVSARDIREREVWPLLYDWLTDEQRMAMESLLPETFILPTRKRPIRINYEPESGRALIASKLQDFYDVDPAILKVGGGRIPLVVELLAPNGRPAQVTADLATFWQTSYQGVKKELKGRYPKHEWR